MASHEDFNKELAALREDLPEIFEEEEGNRSIERVPYSMDLAKRISNAYLQGISLAAISRMGEMPAYATLLKWSKNHPELSKMLQGTRHARALHFEDAAIAAAENACGKDADRLKFEAYKWGAEVNDPLTYGKKVTHAGDSSNPVVLQVITGFGPPNEWQTPPKLNADGTIEVKSEVADAASQDTAKGTETPVGGVHINEGGPESSPAEGRPEESARDGFYVPAMPGE